MGQRKSAAVKTIIKPDRARAREVRTIFFGNDGLDSWERCF